ncbi:hypothetical protein AC578_6219 [Pseudocercospora eumusae]|uniref:Uncharacterized protein n=1 Tax=Pseudocercospora eumusae TaxID=321146 RepID=A0A139H335_9PEZI|nr:hypothetical protein AC578_6219 [Pseudocercospora eumusae]
MAAAQRDVFPFFRLAPELRDQIYEEADAPLRLECAEAYIAYPSTITLTKAPNVGLLLANKQVRSEYLVARSRRDVRQRLVVQVGKSCKPSAAAQASSDPLHDMQQREKKLSLVAKYLEGVSDVDIHFVEERLGGSVLPVPMIRDLLARIMADLSFRNVSLIMHKNMHKASDTGLPQALRTFEHVTTNLSKTLVLRHGALSVWRPVATRIKASVLVHMPLFTPYTCNIYSGIDPDGRIPDLIKNHKQNQVLVEVQKSETRSEFVDVRSLPFCTPGSYHQMENEILQGFLEVYEKERDVEELVAGLEGVPVRGNWVVDPLHYAEYVGGRE